MFNIYICEDKEKVRKQLTKIISNSIKKNKVETRVLLATDNPKEIIMKSKNSSNNIYFLDIALKDEMNGLLLAKRIRNYDFFGYIIFITSHLELSLKIFQYKLKALDFICKDEYIEKRIDECFEVIKKEKENSKKKDEKSKKTILIKSGSNYHHIPINDIIYFETSPERKIVLHTKILRIEFYDTLSNLESQLNKSFIRCHRAYIINMKFMKTLIYNKGNYIAIMQNGEECMVSKKHVKELRDRCE